MALDELLSEFRRIASEAPSQIYYNPDDHGREVWMYVNKGFQ